MKLKWKFFKYLTILDIEIKYLDVGPQAQLPPPYAENILQPFSTQGSLDCLI